MKTKGRKISTFFIISFVLAATWVLFAQQQQEVGASHSVLSENGVTYLRLPGVGPETVIEGEEITSSSVIASWTENSNLAYVQASVITSPVVTGGGTFIFQLLSVQQMNATADMITGRWRIIRNGIPVVQSRLGTISGLSGDPGAMDQMTIMIGQWLVRATITDRFDGVLAAMGIDGAFQYNGDPLKNRMIRLFLAGGMELTTLTDENGVYEFPEVEDLADVNRIVMALPSIPTSSTVISGTLRFDAMPVPNAEVRFIKVMPNEGTQILETVYTDTEGHFTSSVLDVAGFRLRTVIRPQ